MASAAMSPPHEGDWHGAPPPPQPAAATTAAAPAAAPGGAARPPQPPPVPRPVKLVSARTPPPESLRMRVWRTMEDPTYSPLAKLVALVIVVSIALSTVAFVVQTLPQYVFSPDTVWMGIEVTTISIFTVEFAVRLWATPSYGAFFRSVMNWIDVMAIAPFYVELALGGSDAAASAGVLRVARLIRIFRVFKVSRYLPWMRVFGRALLLSLQPLLMLVFVVLIGVVVFASAMYYAERGEWDAALGTYVRVGEDGVPSPSPFRSIPDSMWWAIVTMTTVGYGDTFPVTGPGRFIASVAALCGILVVAIPITVISTNFNNEYGAMLAARATAKARMGLLRRQFRQHRTGLAAVLEEVDELMARNSDEFRSEVDALFAAARAELSEEVSEVVRMAYERRRQLHLAALAAGRLQLPDTASSASASADDGGGGGGGGGVVAGGGLRQRPASGGVGGAAAPAAAADRGR